MNPLLRKTSDDQSSQFTADAYIEWGGQYDHRLLELDMYEGVWEWTDMDQTAALDLGKQVGACKSLEEAKDKLERIVFRIGEPSTYIQWGDDTTIKKKDYLQPTEKKFLKDNGIDRDIKPDFSNGNYSTPFNCKDDTELSKADKIRAKGLGVIGSLDNPLLKKATIGQFGIDYHLREDMENSEPHTVGTNPTYAEKGTEDCDLPIAPNPLVASKNSLLKKASVEDELDNFTHAYITAALWSSTDDEGEPLDDKYGIEDLSPATLKKMQDDCAEFQERNSPTLAKAECNRGSGQYTKEEQAGHDFWLTRVGSGAGFMDGYWGEYGDDLTAAAKWFGDTGLTVGDDGLIYQYGINDMHPAYSHAYRDPHQLDELDKSDLNEMGIIGSKKTPHFACAQCKKAFGEPDGLAQHAEDSKHNVWEGTDPLKEKIQDANFFKESEDEPILDPNPDPLAKAMKSLEELALTSNNEDVQDCCKMTIDDLKYFQEGHQEKVGATQSYGGTPAHPTPIGGTANPTATPVSTTPAPAPVPAPNTPPKPPVPGAKPPVVGQPLTQDQVNTLQQQTVTSAVEMHTTPKDLPPSNFRGHLDESVKNKVKEQINAPVIHTKAPKVAGDDEWHKPIGNHWDKLGSRQSRSEYLNTASGKHPMSELLDKSWGQLSSKQQKQVVARVNQVGRELLYSDTPSNIAIEKVFGNEKADGIAQGGYCDACDRSKGNCVCDKGACPNCHGNEVKVIDEEDGDKLSECLKCGSFFTV